MQCLLPIAYGCLWTFKLWVSAVAHWVGPRWRPSEPQWATEAAAVGPGGDQLGWGHIKILDEVPTET